MNATIWGGLACLLTLANGAAAASDDDLQARLAELETKSARDDTRIAELESRLDSMEMADGEGWLTEQRAAEIRSLVADVLADADTRASMLTRAFVVAYDDGAVIGSGNFKLKTNLHLQHRFLLNKQSGGGADSSAYGFENTRLKFILSGNVVGPEWFYKLEIEVGSVNANLPNGESRLDLNDSLIGYDFGNGWKVTGGTFKTPLLREELVDSRYQLAVERSIVNYNLTGGRTDGILVDYLTDRLHLMGSYNNGINDGFYPGGSISTGGTPAFSTNTADFAVTLRGEFLIEGDWDVFEDFTSQTNEKTAVMIGGAIHFQDTADLDVSIMTLDFSGEFSGGNVFGAIIFASADDAGGTSVDVSALVLQGGLRFSDDWEGFARWEYSDSDELARANVNVLTAGVTRYFADYRAKWTTDIGIGIDRVVDDLPIAGWRGDPAGQDGQIVIRSQLQLVF